MRSDVNCTRQAVAGKLVTLPLSNHSNYAEPISPHVPHVRVVGRPEERAPPYLILSDVLFIRAHERDDEQPLNR